MHKSRVLMLAMLLPAAFAQSIPPATVHYGGFIDFGYLGDFNSPDNHLFRDRGTTPVVDQFNVNMGGLYLKKDATEQSRWGMEFGLNAGKDSEAFGFSATAPNLPGSKWLRHLGPTDVSYLAPVGSGLTIQAGIFSSLIGYDSLYAKDNFSYTRPWGADYTPYLMMGANASYSITPKWAASVCVINGYFHLADANHVPSTCGQVVYKPAAGVTLKQTVLYGPHQSNTGLRYWRVLSDTIAERKRDRFTAAAEYQYSSERLVGSRDSRALWMSAQLPLHWNVHGPWSLTVRPEFCWDRDGRWTGSPQTVRAITSTVEYRLPWRSTQTIVRLEHRYDHGTGSGAGFFDDGSGPAGSRLTPSQRLLIVGVIVTLDSSNR